MLEDDSFDGDGEEEGFWHERGQCVIMMSLGVYSETDWRMLLYCVAPKGCHYQLEVSRDLSTGQTHRKWSYTHTHTHKGFILFQKHPSHPKWTALSGL